MSDQGTHTSSNDKVKKTRNRVPTSCENCRRRKLKCDRRRPCSNCVRSHSENLCKYAMPLAESSPKARLSNEIIQLKVKIHKLEKILKINNIDPNQYSDIALVMNTEENGSENSINTDDELVSLAQKFDKMVIKENRLLHSGTTTFVTFISSDAALSDMYQKFMKMHTLAYKEYLQRQRRKPSDFPDGAVNQGLAMLTNNLVTGVNLLSGCTADTNNLPVDGLLDYEETRSRLITPVLEEINKKMPPMAVVNVLVDNFFNRVHSFIPFIDEATFREEITYVLATDGGEKSRVALTHIENASIISMLLLVLRYSYLAVNVEDVMEGPKAFDNIELYNMVKSNQVIDAKIPTLARDLLYSLPESFSIKRKVTFRNIQVLLLLRLYQGYSPELNEENRENILNLVTIIQMARVMGMNRDPSYYPTILKDERENILRRRIWYELMMLDACSAQEYGCPLTIHDDEYDVELPKLTISDQAVLKSFRKGATVDVSSRKLKQIVSDYAVNEEFSVGYKATLLLREAMQTFQNFSEPTKRSQLDVCVKKLEDFLEYKLPSLTSLVQGDNIEGDMASDATILRIFQVSRGRMSELRMTMIVTTNCLYYLLFLNEGNNWTETKIQYAVRATETSLILVKSGIDYLTYCQQPSSTTDEVFQMFNNFSQRLNKFILVRTLIYQQRGGLWMFSLFANCLENRMNFADILSQFSNSTDSLCVLDWFNTDNTSSQYLDVLFGKLKQFYFMNAAYKSDFFVCWRSSMMVQMFINYIKDFYPIEFARFNRVAGGAEVEPKDCMYLPDATQGSIPDALASDTSGSIKSPDTPVLDLTEKNNYGMTLEDALFEGTPSSPSGQLFYEDMNDTLRAIWKDSFTYDPSIQMDDDEPVRAPSPQASSAWFSTPSMTSRSGNSSYAHTGSSSGPVSNSPPKGGSLSSTKTTTFNSESNPSLFDNVPSQRDIDQGPCPYIGDSPIVKEKQMNLTDLLERLEQEPGFHIN